MGDEPGLLLANRKGRLHQRKEAANTQCEPPAADLQTCRLAQQDCCAKMMQHWRYGTHFQMQKLKQNASDSAAAGGRADMLAIGLPFETHIRLLSRMELLLAT